MIELPFLPRWEAALVNGDKTATTRRSKKGEPGERFQAFGHTFRFTAVARMRLGDVKDFWWREEGCATPFEFRRVWLRLHPRRGFVPSDQVYLHLFRRAEPTRLDVRTIARSPIDELTPEEVDEALREELGE